MEEVSYNNLGLVEEISNVLEEKARSFEDLSVWKKAHALVKEIYSITRRFPKDELYGLTNQIRRAAVSIPANIAEGFGRYSKAEKIRFYNISQGSINEVKYFLILARDLNYADTSSLISQADEISKILDSYIKRIKEDI